MAVSEGNAAEQHCWLIIIGSLAGVLGLTDREFIVECHLVQLVISKLK